MSFIYLEVDNTPRTKRILKQESIRKRCRYLTPPPSKTDQLMVDDHSIQLMLMIRR